MSKESFRTKIENSKKQIIEQRLNPQIEVREFLCQTRQERIREEEEYEIQKRKAAEPKRQEAIKVFSGTNIIETLEEIRDEEILDCGKYYLDNLIEIKNIFGRGTGRYKAEKIEITKPMIILYDENSLIAKFSPWSYSDEDGDNEVTNYRIIKITKYDDDFGLEYGNDHYCDLIVWSKNPLNIINGISRRIATDRLK